MFPEFANITIGFMVLSKEKKYQMFQLKRSFMNSAEQCDFVTFQSKDKSSFAKQSLQLKSLKVFVEIIMLLIILITSE